MESKFNFSREEINAEGIPAIILSGSIAFVLVAGTIFFIAKPDVAIKCIEQFNIHKLGKVMDAA
jgi:hypothetical protein